MSIALAIAGAIAAAFPGRLSEDWTTLLLWHGNEGVTTHLSEHLPEGGLTLALLLLLSAGLFGYAIAVVIGMFLFWRFARFGWVLLTALTVALVPFDGLVVMTPLQAAILQLTLILDGVIVAMSYLPPIRSEFERGMIR